MMAAGIYIMQNVMVEGRGGGMAAGGKIENEDLGEKCRGGKKN